MVTETPRRCSVVPSGAGVSGVPYQNSSRSWVKRTMLTIPRAAAFGGRWQTRILRRTSVELKRHDGVRVLDAQREALEDGEYVSASRVDETELRCRVSCNSQIHCLARERE